MDMCVCQLSKILSKIRAHTKTRLLISWEKCVLNYFAIHTEETVIKKLTSGVFVHVDIYVCMFRTSIALMTMDIPTHK